VPALEGCSHCSVTELATSSATTSGCPRGTTRRSGVRGSNPPKNWSRAMSEATKTQPAMVMTSALPCSPGCGLDLTIEKAKIATKAAPIGATRRRRAAILVARACLSAARVGAADSAPGSPVMLAMLRTRASDSIGR
jgi:hypothetical protein